MIRKQDRPAGLRSVAGAHAGAAAGALAGILAAAVALGVAELAAAIIGPDSAPVVAVGETAINLTPIPVKDFAIAHFGSHDKLALVAGILVMLAGFAALIGVLAVGRIGYGLAGLAVFAGLGVTAALQLPGAGPLDAVPALAGVTAAAGALVTLLRSVRPREPRQVGGSYAGNARWLGAPLAALLRRAGVRAGADQVLSSAADGMSISTPLTAIMDGRDALLAVGMNGQPLPVAHGFPARMVVPGLYGYTSATKWVTRLTVTTFAARRAYWTQRGYAAVAPIHTESRIDVPKPLAQVTAGRVAVAGVAWAPATGIAAVQVNVDSGPWQTARLAAADGTDTWRQWTWTWDAAPGLHTLQVRATDNNGVTQPSRRAQVFPSGATGWDSVVVTVT